MSSVSAWRPARITTGVTCPQLTMSSLNVAGSQRAMIAVISAAGPGISRRVRCMSISASCALPPLRRLARSAPSATALLAAARVLGPSPSASVIHTPSRFSTTVEPVAGDLIARQHVAGHLAAADPRDPRREQALLDLGGRERPLAALGAGEGVRVPVGQGDRRRRLPSDLGEWAARPSQRQHHARRPSPEPERDDLDPGAVREPARSSSSPAESSSGPIANGTSISSGRRSGPATRKRCEPSMSST